jgi:hypothetical protein
MKEDEVRITLIFIQQDKHIDVGRVLSIKKDTSKSEALAIVLRQIKSK